MKISIVQGAFLPVPPVAGGAVEKLWFELGREFARRGLHVTHISRTWPSLPDRSVSDGVTYRRIAGFNFPRSGLLAKLMDLVYSVRCFLAVEHSDVIVTNTFFLPLLLSLFARRGIVYVSVHRYPQGQMKLYGKVDRLQCVSTAVADAVRDQAPGVASLVKVVPNYVPACLNDADWAAGWTARRQEVLFVGRIHPEKGLDLLIRAFASIEPARRAGWSLRIVGPHAISAGGGGDEFLKSLHEAASAADLTVDWVGPIYDREELEMAYCRARIFVYPSVAAKGEAFPLAPLEAMAQGCPTITSDLLCFSDYVRPGENADFFALASDNVARSLGSVLEALMADDQRRHAYSAAGLETARNFTLTRIADAFVQDFTSLLRT